MLVLLHTKLYNSASFFPDKTFHFNLHHAPPSKPVPTSVPSLSDLSKSNFVHVVLEMLQNPLLSSFLWFLCVQSRCFARYSPSVSVLVSVLSRLYTECRKSLEAIFHGCFWRTDCISHSAIQNMYIDDIGLVGLGGMMSDGDLPHWRTSQRTQNLRKKDRERQMTKKDKQQELLLTSLASLL